MLDTFRTLIANQLTASLCKLNTCVVRCPDDLWGQPLVNFPFRHVAYHTLFYADLFLGPNESEFREQTFHQNNSVFFNDYDELSYDSSVTAHSKDAIRRYMAHCRSKVADTIAKETAQSLSGPTGYE